MNFEEEIASLKEENKKLTLLLNDLSNRLDRLSNPRHGGCTTLGENAVIDDTTVVYSGKTYPVVIGDNSRVWRDGEWTGPIVVGKNVVVGQHSYFRENVTVEDNVFIGPLVRLITDTRDIRNWKSRAGDPKRAPIRIGQGSWICADSTILAGVTVGSGSVVLAGSVVTEDVPENCVVQGVPARVVKTLEPLKLVAEQSPDKEDEVEFSIVTMSRGDEKRLTDWVQYHHGIGFNRFIILLDNPNDNSEQVLLNLAQKEDINIECIVKEPLGEYIDGVSPQEFRKRVLDWKKRNKKELEESPYSIIDPLSWRQYQYIPEVLEGLCTSGKNGWVAVIDVDEYIVIENHQNIADFVDSYEQPRIRFTNYNFDMEGWDGESLPRDYATHRWDIDELAKLDNAWSRRVKSVVRYDAAKDMISVHGISRGAFVVADSHVARLHHYKTSHQEIGIGYNAEDTTIVS